MGLDKSLTLLDTSAAPAAGVTADVALIYSKAVSGAYASAALQNGAQACAPPPNWTVVSNPAAATQATATKAAGTAGVRHVCTAISACINTAATAQTPVNINLINGPSGGGSILWSRSIQLPANGNYSVDITGLCIVGAAATAMTLEFSAAGVAASQESVTITGFDIS